VTSEQRTHAKRLAYGLLYGMGPTKLASDLNTDVASAAALSDDFRRSLQDVDTWLVKVR
jgi:DNA polymerase theta